MLSFFRSLGSATLLLGTALLSPLQTLHAAVPTENWTVKRAAGAFWQRGLVNGDVNTARFGSFGGIAVDPAGNIFVADIENHVIRKITPAGIVSTYAGSTKGYKDGAGAAAQFTYPDRVALDPQGNLYVSELLPSQDSSRIRKVSPTGQVTTFRTLSTTIRELAFYNYGSTANLAYLTTGNNLYRTPLSISNQSADGVEVGTADAITSNPNGTLYKRNGRTIEYSSGASFVQANYSLESIDYLEESRIMTVDVSGNIFINFNYGGGIFRASPNGGGSGWVSKLEDSYDYSWSKIGAGNTVYWSNVTGLAVSSRGTVYAIESSWKENYTDEFGESVWYFYDGSPAIISAILPFTLPETIGSQTVSATSTPSPLSVSVSSGNVSYQWYRSGAPIPGATGANYTPAANSKTIPGIYYATISSGTANSLTSWVTKPIPVRVTNTAVENVKSTIQSANSGNWNANLASAKTALTPLASTNDEAKLLSAFISIAGIAMDPATIALKNKLGITEDLNPFGPSPSLPETIQAGLKSADGRSWLLNTVFPQLKAAEASLAGIKDRNFFTALFNPPGITSAVDYSEVLVDFADVQLARALLRSGMWAIKTLESNNTDFDVDTLISDYEKGKLSVSGILARFPQLLSPSTTAKTAATDALASATEAVNAYLLFSDFLRETAATKEKRLFPSIEDSPFAFDIGASDLADEGAFRTNAITARDSFTAKTDAAGLKTFSNGADSVTLSAKPLISRSTGWRNEALALGFNKNQASSTGLTNPNSALVKTIKAVYPAVTTADLQSAQDQLQAAEPAITAKLHTREDQEGPATKTNALAKLPGSNKVTSDSGYITLTGTVTDASEVISLTIFQKSSDGENYVDAYLTEVFNEDSSLRYYAWTAQVPVGAGTNTFKVYAFDKWKAMSDTPEVFTADIAVTYPLVIDVDGQGSLSGAPSGGTVEGGTTLNLVATPYKDWIFNRYEIWVNGEELPQSSDPKLTLKVTGETRIVPVFTPNPFRLIKDVPVTVANVLQWNWAGGNNIASDSNIVRGLISATIDKNRGISGRFRVGRESVAFNGTFDQLGRCQIALPYPIRIPSTPSGGGGSSSQTKYISRDLELRIDEIDNIPHLYVIYMVSNLRRSNGEGASTSPINFWLGSVKPAPAVSSVRFTQYFNGPREESSYSYYGISSSGLVAGVTAFGDGEKTTLSARLQSPSAKSWIDSGRFDHYENAPEEENGVRIATAAIASATSNKYALAITKLFLRTQNESGSFYLGVDGLIHRLSSGNLWAVNANGTRIYDSASEGGWWRGFGSDHDGTSYIPQYYAPSGGSLLGLNSGESLNFLASSNEGGGNTVGYVTWNGSDLVVDNSAIANDSSNSSLVKSGTSKLQFKFNPATGIFSGSVGWKNDIGVAQPAKKFTGVYVQPAPEYGNSNGYGVGFTSDGYILRFPNNY